MQSADCEAVIASVFDIYYFNAIQTSVVYVLHSMAHPKGTLANHRGIVIGMFGQRIAPSNEPTATIVCIVPSGSIFS
jgi:hypothetical protein